MEIEIIKKYFGEKLSEKQIQQFIEMGELYKEWNQKINVISRKDIDNIYLHHILHSLSIAKVMDFKDSSIVMDIGCGGGFPGIPLAVLYPNVEFLLIDSITKKIKVVDALVESLGLTNVKTFNDRAENVRLHTDFVVSRAVTTLEQFIGWSWRKIRGGNGNGILYLKGGDIAEEIAIGTSSLSKVDSVNVINLSDLFEEDFFDTKKIVYIKKSKN